jgi:hypothetical protein
MRKEQLIQQILEKLQQLTEAQLNQVNQFITRLLGKSKAGSYTIPEKESSNVVNESVAKYITNINSRLQALSEDQVLTLAIMKLADQSESCQFLSEEENLYSLEDLQEVYHA